VAATLSMVDATCVSYACNKDVGNMLIVESDTLYWSVSPETKVQKHPASCQRRSVRPFFKKQPASACNELSALSPE
jgi:hypothetical protein